MRVLGGRAARGVRPRSGGIGCADNDPIIPMLSLWLSSSSPDCLGHRDDHRRGACCVAGRAFFDRDDFLDDLLDHSQSPVEQCSEVSRRADVAFETRAKLSDEAVLVSFWRRPELSLSSGTPTGWIAELADPVELWCRCDPDVQWTTSVPGGATRATVMAGRGHEDGRGNCDGWA